LCAPSRSHRKLAQPVGKALEIIGSVAVLVLGAWPLVHRFVF
jgi:ethanolamine transporter EutH